MNAIRFKSTSVAVVMPICDNMQGGSRGRPGRKGGLLDNLEPKIELGDYCTAVIDIQTEDCPRNAQAVLVYDVANRASFEELEQWLAEAADFGAGGIPMAVCANKVHNPNIPPDSTNFAASYTTCTNHAWYIRVGQQETHDMP